MSESSHAAGQAGPLHRVVEFGIAGFCALIGLITIIGSLQVGIGWGAEGPKSGFFPFYIGLLIVLSSAVNCIQIWMRVPPGKVFAAWGQLRHVLSVVIPTTIYVFLVPYSGIYVASAILIAVFMKWLGKYRWDIMAAVALGVPVAVYVLFEKWFLVPLPKGPLEDLLGL
jgi:hypothetical protein